MIENWKRTLSDKAAAWGLPSGGEWNFLFHNNYQPTGSTINLLWFYGNERFPRVVTKMSRDQEVVSREFRNLQDVYAVAPRHVPRPMHLGDADGFGMLWMAGVPGRRIPPGRRDSIDMLRRSAEMVISIHKGLKTARASVAADRYSRTVTAPLDAVVQSGGPALREGCRALLSAATPAWLEGLPSIPQHGDLFLDNVLYHRDEYHIVDWENFGEIDLPFYDLLTLCLSFLRASGDAPEHWDPKVAGEIPALVDRYAAALQLPAAAADLLLPLALANWFYLHWTEGRAAAGVMQAALEHYFEHKDYWEKVFFGRDKRNRQTA